VSSATSEQWKEAVIAAGDAEERKSSSSSRDRIITSRSPSRQNDGQDEEIQVEGDTRTSSAKSTQEGTETKATLGSEADLAQVSEAVVRSQSVVEGVFEEMLAEEETAELEWPGVAEHEEDAKPEEMNRSDDEDSISQELAISTPEGLPEGFPGEELMPIPSVNVQESSEPDSIQPGTQVAVYIMRFEISFFFVTMGLSNVKSHFFKRGARGEHNEKNVNVKISETTY